jgi:ABC-2 type transport system ATP-binding protein
MPPTPPRPDAAAIEARELAKRYGEVVALDSLSFAAPPSSVFALLGPNGAGKTTAVKILTTLSTADSGSARVAGHDVVRDAARVRRAIGVVSQRTAVDLEATGAENVRLHGHLRGISGAELTTRTRELLERFGLSDAAHRIVKTYSGGMQRRLDVATALVHRPEVLFLDEPTTGLDPEARSDLWAEIARLARQEGTAVLLTTHYLEEADRLADTVAIVDRGRIVAGGSPDELKRDLRGDSIQIELEAAGDPGRARSALDPLNGALRDVAVEGRTVRARVESGPSTLPAVLAALAAAGVGVESATLARPSLDDVYLRHTGRAYHADAEREIR